MNFSVKIRRLNQCFLRWIDFEIEFGNSNAAIDVGDKGDAVIPNGDWEWLAKRAASYFARGRSREARREFTDAIRDLEFSASYLANAFKNAPASAKESVKSAGQQVNDAIWKIGTESGQFSYFEQYQMAKSAFDRGDKRAVCLSRRIDTIEAGALDAGHRVKNNSQLHLWAREVEKALEYRNLDRLSERLAKLNKKLSA
jgi:tetratricopeptide (TPR) repeat protein